MSAEGLNAVDSEMLRRAATAVRNVIGTSRRHAWATWVPQHLDQLADLIDTAPVEWETT